MTFDPTQREGRFGSGSGGVGMGSDFGFDDVAQNDPLNKKYIRRNLREYQSLKKFGKKGGLKKLAGRNTAQLERLAVQAVLKKNKVKRRKLNTKVKRSAHSKRALRIAKKKLRQGYDIRRKGQQGKSIGSIKNKKVRKAAKHIANIRRNRAIMKTPLMAGQGYNIRMGHTSLRTARKRNYWRKKKRR
jgi:hypothetical protein